PENLPDIFESSLSSLQILRPLLWQPSLPHLLRKRARAPVCRFHGAADRSRAPSGRIALGQRQAGKRPSRSDRTSSRAFFSASKRHQTDCKSLSGPPAPRRCDSVCCDFFACVFSSNEL